jgi:hypothetical protein
MALANETVQAISLLSQELFSSIGWIIQAIGGLFVIYIILIIVKMVLMKRELNILKQIEIDVKKIKKKLKIK